MKKIILSTVLVAASVLAAGAQTGQEANAFYINTTPQFENYIQITGAAEREITPDEIFVRIVISENTNKGKVSVEKMERDMIARLKSLGIDTDKDLKLWDMNSSLKEYWLRKNATRTTSSYELKVNSGKQLAQVYAALEDMGITNINIARLSHSKIKEYRNEIRLEALKNARDIAVSLAGSIGQKAGRAVHIIDYTPALKSETTLNTMMVRTGGYAADVAGETTPEMRDIRITHSLTVKFELE